MWGILYCCTAVLTIFFRFSSVLTVCVLPAAPFCQHVATMFECKFTPQAVASPDAPQKPLVRKRARSGGAEWVQVTRHPVKQRHDTGEDSDSE